MTEIMPSLQNLINLSYDPRRNRRLFWVNRRLDTKKRKFNKQLIAFFPNLWHDIPIESQGGNDHGYG